LHFKTESNNCARIGKVFRERQVDSVEKMLNLRGALRGRTAPGGAVSGSSLLACASVLAGQRLCQGERNRSVLHGKEKVYGSIP
jgi:hypothetical protein